MLRSVTEVCELPPDSRGRQAAEFPSPRIPGGAGEVGGDDVGRVPAQAAAATVIPHRRPRVRMGGCLLDIAERHPGIQSGSDERVPERVGHDGLGDPGPAGGLADDPPGAVPVQPPAVGGQEHRPAGALADGQVDRPGGPRGERDGDDLAALIGTSGSPVLCEMRGAGDLSRQQSAGEHLFRPGREVLTQDRAPAGSPGGWTADGVACPALAVSTVSLRALAVLPAAAGRDAEGRKDEVAVHRR